MLEIENDRDSCTTMKVETGEKKERLEEPSMAASQD